MSGAYVDAASSVTRDDFGAFAACHVVTVLGVLWPRTLAQAALRDWPAWGLQWGVAGHM